MKDLHLTDAPAPATSTGCCGGSGCCGGGAATVSTDALAGGVTATYTVSGMTCGHCVAAVTDEVGGIPGVTGVTVDLDSGRLVVASAAPVDFDRIVEAVGEAGDYTVE